MPKYQVELQNGKKYVVEADSMPTEEEVSLELQKNPEYMKGLSTSSSSGEMTDAQWATLSPADKMRNVLQWGGKAIAGMTGMGSAGRQAVDNPKTALATAAVPGVISSARTYAPAIVQPVVNKAIQVIENPLVGGSVGAYEGYKMGGIPGAALGAVAGAAGSSKMSTLLNKVRPGASVAEQLGVTAPEAVLARESAAVRTGPGIVARTRPMTFRGTNEAGDWYDNAAGSTRVVPRGSPVPTEPINAPLPLRGRSATPPVQESLRSQGEGLLAPDAAAHRAALNVEPPTPRLVPSHNNASLGDMSRPGVQDTVQRMAEEARRLVPNHEPYNAAARTNQVPSEARMRPDELRPRTLEEAYALINERPPVPSSTVRGSAPPATVGAERADFLKRNSPNAGGRLAGRRMNPTEALDIALSGAPEGFSESNAANVVMRDQIQPPVYLSPKAQAAVGNPPSKLATLEDELRQREQTAAASRQFPAPPPAPAPIRASAPRGQTTGTASRILNQNTLGWQDVSLEEPVAVPSHKRPSEVPPIETIARSLPNTSSASAKAMAARLRELELNPLARSVYPELEQEYQGLLNSIGRYAKTGGLTSAGTGNWQRPTPTGRK